MIHKMVHTDNFPSTLKRVYFIGWGHHSAAAATAAKLL